MERCAAGNLNRWQCSVVLDEELMDGSIFGTFDLEQVEEKRVKSVALN